MEEKKYSDEMRGTLWLLAEAERRQNGPIATGMIQVSGVRLRIAMWPKRKVAKPGSAADGKIYFPISVEYPQGVTRFLASVDPASVVATAARAESQMVAQPMADSAVVTDDALPF